jgi:GNAT superfamily N-acetyltransferase
MTGSGCYQLRDGRPVVLRDAGAADLPALTRLYLELSPDSFRSRFHAGQPAPDFAARLARPSPRPGSVCVLAAEPGVPGRLAGEGRYVPAGDGAAEIGLTVADRYQGAGLGGLLLRTLAARARAAGIARLRAVVLLANAPMLSLLGRYGWALAEPIEEFSVACLEISAVGGMPGWPAAAAGRRVLVERRGWFDDERMAGLRAAGYDVRLCSGPRPEAGRACPLVTAGSCRLAEEADLILALLPAAEAGCAAVTEAHRQRWPERLAP